MSKWFIMAMVVAGVGFILSPAVRAEEEQHAGMDMSGGMQAEMPMGEHMKEGAMPMDEHADMGKENEQAAEMPATIGGIWNAVKNQEEKLGKVVSTQKLDEVPAIASAIRDHVNALAEKSADLAAEQLEKVRADARSVVELTARLESSSKAGDPAVTDANFKTLQGLLKAIEALYPADMLKAKADEDAGPSSAVVYTCPMHPDVTSDKPGKCPKCGMKLRPKS